MGTERGERSSYPQIALSAGGPMPTYEYECSKGHQFDFDQSIKDEPLKTCRKKTCRSKVRRLISKTSFRLKGSGWFSDGYGSGKQKK